MIENEERKKKHLGEQVSGSIWRGNNDASADSEMLLKRTKTKVIYALNNYKRIMRNKTMKNDCVILRGNKKNLVECVVETVFLLLLLL